MPRQKPDMTLQQTICTKIIAKKTRTNDACILRFPYINEAYVT